MLDVHAKLSASSSARWLACPGSVKLCEGLPEKASSFAEEGRLAHAVGELKLQKYFVKGIGPVRFRRRLDDFKRHPMWHPEMERYTDEYFEAVKALSLTYPERPFVVIEERVDFSEWVPEGFGTADCLMLYGDELTVIDFKYGKGVPVSPEHNSQLMLYALGAYAAYSWVYDVQKINLWVIQPRTDNTASWSLTVEELLAFGERVKPAAQEAYDGSARLAVGDHCRFCKAKSRCPARAQQLFDVLEAAAPYRALAQEKGKPAIHGVLDNAEIARILKASEGLCDWLESVKREALAELLEGRPIEGYKAVEGRSNRTITDEPALARALIEAGYDEALIYKPKALETLTNLEKLCGKKAFAEIGKGLVDKPQGKPTLVPERDKRPVYQKKAEQYFEKVEGE